MKYGKGQAEDCGQVFHRESLTGNVGVEESGVEVYSDHLLSNKP